MNAPVIRLIFYTCGVLLLAAGCGQHTGPDDPVATRRHSNREAEEEEVKRPDRPDLALAQEIALTRDPATGTVPRERLLVAQAQQERLLRQQAAQRPTAGSLSSAIWTEKGPSNVGGRVRALLPDPADASGNTVWAGSVGGGLWKSTNAAGPSPTWTKVNDLFANLAVTTLVADPRNADVLYFGTGEGFGNGDAIQGMGIWKSVNHGATWTHLPSTSGSAFHFVNRLAVDTNGWLYAATNSGLHRSSDQGATWTNVLPQPSRVWDVDINPTNNAVYACGWPIATGIYRSATGNPGSFVNLSNLAGSGLPAAAQCYRLELALAPSAPARMYVLCGGVDNRLLGIYRTSDGGTTWQSLPEPADVDAGIPDTDFTREQAWYDLAIAVSPTDPNTVLVGGIDLFKTSTGGNDPAAVEWQQLTHWYGGYGYPYIHADQHAIAFAPGSGARVYFGNDGGLATSGNADVPFPSVRHINSSFNVTQFYSVAAHPTDFGYFLAGAQDNGTQLFQTAAGTQTHDINGGDGGFCFIDQDQPQYQFASYVYSNISRTTRGAEGWAQSESICQSNYGYFINPMEYDSNANTLYFGYANSQLARIIRATGPLGNPSTGPLQSVLTLPAGAGDVTHVALSPNVANRVYVGTDLGQLYRIDDAAGARPVFTLLYDRGTLTSISCITVERSSATPEPDQHLLFTFAHYGIVSVLQTVNGGTTWASAEGNLPDMPVRWVVLDPANGQRAMLATELGVWTTDDLTAAPVLWQPANTNFANVRVDMLRIRPTDRVVVAATHGRGLFTSDIFSVSPLPVQLTQFSATPSGTAAVQLNWTTASEQNSARFEVERKVDAAPFSRIAVVAAAGTSGTLRTYRTTDAALPAGAATLYYRLRQVDLDGTATYSPVRVVVAPVPVGLAMQAYPNPYSGPELRVQVHTTTTGPATLTATDLTGRVLLRRPTQLTKGITTVPLAEAAQWTRGAYLLHLQQGSHRETLKLWRD